MTTTTMMMTVMMMMMFKILLLLTAFNAPCVNAVTVIFQSDSIIIII